MSTYACFVDAKNAFATVNRHCLWYKLYSLGLSVKILTAVKSLYSDVKCALNVNGHITRFLDVDLGVKQGCRLSPTFCAIYVND